MSADTGGGVATQVVRGRPGSGVDGRDGNVQSRAVEWEPEITVVGEHDCRVHLIGEHVDEQVAGHVDVRALLLERGYRHQQFGLPVRTGHLLGGQPRR